MHGALGIMFRVFARERTGKGQHVDVSYLDTTIALLAATPNMRYYLAMVWPPSGERASSADRTLLRDLRDQGRQAPDHRLHGAWLWENFCKAIGRPDFVRFARKHDQFVRAANAERSRRRRRSRP